MGPTTNMREYDAAQRLQKIYGEHVSTFGGVPFVHPDRGNGPPEIRGLTPESAYLTADIILGKAEAFDDPNGVWSATAPSYDLPRGRNPRLLLGSLARNAVTGLVVGVFSCLGKVRS